MTETTPPAKILSPEYLAEDNGSEILRVAIVFTVLEIIFVCLFFTSRIRSKTANNIDTYLMIPAFVFNFGLLGELYYDVSRKISGRHMAALPESHFKLWRKAAMFATFMYLPSMTFPKLSILYLYLRVFSRRAFRIGAYIIAAILVVNCIIGWILLFIQCTPFKFIWDKSVEGGLCINQILAYAWISFPNILTDIAMLILPLPIIWKLQTTRNQKIGLSITFATFSLGLVTSILRFSFILGIDAIEKESWYRTSTRTWNVIESGMYLISASLPSVRALLVPMFERIKLISIFSRFRSERTLDDDGESKRSNFERSNGVFTPVDVELSSSSRRNDYCNDLATYDHTESVPGFDREGSHAVLERVRGSRSDCLERYSVGYV